MAAAKMEGMPLQPKPSTFPAIRGALKFYQVAAPITGVLLLSLCAEMLMKYAFGLELELGGAYGFLAFVPSGTATAVNLSTGNLIIHGWFYVVYLFAAFRLWSLMRWNVLRLLWLALGGIIPFLSFFFESRIPREVKGYLSGRETAAAAEPVESMQ